MKYYDVLYEAAARANVATTRIGEAIGKHRGYISTSKARGSDPSTANAARMLAVCGYALAAVPVDDLPETALTIDAAPATDDERRAALARKRDALQRQADAITAELGE